MAGIRSKVVIAGVAALALAACGSSPPPPLPPVTLQGVFIDINATNPSSTGSTCASFESGLYQLSVKADRKTRTVDLTFGNTLAGYVPTGTFTQPVWTCVGQWSVTLPQSASGWVFILTPASGSSSSVTVPASSSGSSVALDDDGGNSGGSLELSDSSVSETALAAKPQPGAAAAVQMNNWCTELGSQGFGNMMNVNTDLNTINTDYGNSQFGSVENDGTKLLENAAAGQLDPPPVSAHRKADYVAYMKDVGLVGGDMAQGDFTLGWNELSQVAQYHTVMQDIANQCNAAWNNLTQTPQPPPGCSVLRGAVFCPWRLETSVSESEKSGRSQGTNPYPSRPNPC